MQFTKSYADSKIRPKCEASKIDILLTRTHVEEGLEFIAPTEVAELDEVTNGNVDGDDICASGEVISEGDTVVDEKDVELPTTDVLKDLRVVYSDDEFDLNEQF